MSPTIGRVRTIVSSLCLIALAAAPAALAQETGLVNVLNVHIQLGHQQHYEATIPKLWEAFRKAGVTHQIEVSASVEDPGTYTFVVPVASFADLGTLRDSVNKAFASAPQVMAELSGMSLSQDQSVWAIRPDLSYLPTTPRVAEAEQGFARIAFIYVRPDQALPFEAALRDAGALWKKHAIADARTIAQLVIGDDGPIYAVIIGAKDEADFYVSNAKATQKMGAEWQAYLDRTGPMLRRVEFETSAARRGLTYQP